jgi:hypothetical protein
MKHHIFAKRGIEHLVNNLLWIHPLVVILMCHQSIPDYDGLLGSMNSLLVESKLIEFLSGHLMADKGTESIIAQRRLIRKENATGGKDKM